MSLCTSLFMDGKIHVWADSRVSTEVNGKNYLVTDDYKKIRQVGNKVIFISGDADLAERVFMRIKPDSSIEVIRNRARSHYNEFVRINGSKPAYQTEHGIGLGIYVFTIETTVPVFYQMHHKNDFEIDRQEPEDKQIFTVAARSDEALEYIGELTSRGGAIDIDEVVMTTYEHLANEFIGGRLYSFLVTAQGIYSVAKEIKEKRSYPKWRGRQFPYRADHKGNVLANKLTANSAQIKSSNFTDGAIVGSSINVGNGQFTVDTAGNMYAGNGRFRGNIEASVITGTQVRGSTVTGSLIQTAEAGIYPRAEMSNTSNMFSVQSSPTRGIRMRSTGFPTSNSDINFYSDGAEAQITLPDAFTGLYFSAPKITMETSEIMLRGYNGVVVPSWGKLRNEDTGTNLAIELQNKANAHEAGYNLTFDSQSRNLKMWSKGGQLLAQVPIPSV